MCISRNCTRPLFKDGYCKTHSPELQRAARAANMNRYKGYTLKRDYGISFQTFIEMLEEQNGLCAICEVPDGSERSNNNGSKRLSVDHDHKTGLVRGLLCSSCNKGLGLLMDSPALLLKAAEYLELPQKKRVSDAGALAKAVLDDIMDL